MAEEKQRKIIFEYEYHFDVESIKRAKENFDRKKGKGVIEGEFEKGDWVGCNRLKRIGISFQLDSEKYRKHGYSMLGINEKLMGTMLRCYVSLVCTGVYTFESIRNKSNLLIDFLETIGDPDFSVCFEEISVIKEFLFFIDTPPEMTEKICKIIHMKKERKRGVRELEAVVTYMVFNDAIDNLYSDKISDQEYIKWFPIYFWDKLTFILPLRATETLVTPFDCIKKESDETVNLITRVTKLKRHNYRVYYDVEKDYELVSYELNANYPKVIELISKIEKYRDLTCNQERPFLFAYGTGSRNEFFSVSSLNNLIASFMDTYVIGNPQYDYVRSISNISEFNYITAGDSRPLALQNVYFQDFSLDICRQLAKHTSSEVTSSYIRNMSNTVVASAIMKVHKKHTHEKNMEENVEKKNTLYFSHNKESVCTSLKRMLDGSDISDCIEQRCIEECWGCKFYRPAKVEIERVCAERKKKLDEQAERIRSVLSNLNAAKKSGVNLDYEFLNIQTAIQRCEDSFVEKDEVEYQKWKRENRYGKQDEI